jgi:hypothetical protein
MDTYAVVCTQGEMGLQEIRAECKPERWVPILVMRCEGKTKVPTFTNPDVAKQFVRRNLPERWRKGSGVVNVTAEYARIFKSKGWEVLTYDFPRKMVDIVEFDIEVVEYTDDVDVVTRR